MSYAFPKTKRDIMIPEGDPKGAPHVPRQALVNIIRLF